MSSTSPNLCPAGQEIVPGSWMWDLSSHTWTWNCRYIGAPVEAPVSVECSAEESYCGDEIIGTGINYTGQEACDDGNTNNNDGCNNDCQIPAGVCG